MCGAPEFVPAFGARTFLVLSVITFHNYNGSKSTVVETVEQT
jgi:hypothetical protein